MDVLLETAEKEAVTEIKIVDMHDVTECRYENGRQYFSYQKYKILRWQCLVSTSMKMRLLRSLPQKFF